MPEIRIPDLCRDQADGQIGGAEQALCLLHFLLNDIILQVHAGFFLKKSGHVIRIQVDSLGQFFPAQLVFQMVSIVFAAGAFTGVVKNSGMLAAMTDALVSIIPTSMGTFIAPIVGLFSVPLSLLFDPDSYYYGVMPVIANAVSAMGGNALAVAKASIMGQMTLGFPLSPLTGATFLLLGLSGQDLGDHQKHTLPYAWAASAIMVAVGCVACGLLF